jgi:four helix bundle protein
MFGFERLAVWGKAVDFADRVYVITRGFPSDERFGLASQLRRAAVSVSSNIAEGSARQSRKDFCRFLEIAYGSLLECISQLMIARRQHFMSEDDFKNQYLTAQELARMLSGMKKSLRRKRDDG